MPVWSTEYSGLPKFQQKWHSKLRRSRKQADATFDSLPVLLTLARHHMLAAPATGEVPQNNSDDATPQPLRSVCSHLNFTHREIEAHQL